MAKPTAPSGALAVTYDASLADLSLPERIAELIFLSQRFGRVLPVHRIDPATGVCTCGGFVKRKGKITDVPCHAGKHPNLWKWQVKASSDPKQLAKWADKFPCGNFGVVTGETGDVIDVDTRQDVDGMDSFRALEAEIGIDLMAIAVVVKTGNGIQLWFKHDPAGRLKTGSGIRPAIDIRGGHKGKGLGMAIAPGSKHPNGNIYQIVSGAEHGLQPVPEALIQALYYQQSNNSLSTVCVVGGGGARETAAKGRGRDKVSARKDGAQRFVVNPDAKLTAERRADLEILQCQRPKLRSTWSMTRANSPWPFKEGRNSPSEYEGSISCHLVWAGWSEQEIMDVICVWRRERGLPDPVYYSRYAYTIGTAVAMITPRTLYAGARKDPKGAWKHGYTRNHILGSIIDAPRTTKQIADITGIDHPHVKVVIGRLHKDNKVIRDNHTYLCAPTEVPWYLQNIPEAIDEFSAEEMKAQYDAWVASGGLNTLEENIEAAEETIIGLDEPIEAPEMYSQPPVALHKALSPNFDELDPVEYVITGLINETDEVSYPRDLSVYFEKMMDSMRETRMEAMWDTYGNNPAPKKKKKKQKKSAGWNKFPVGPLDPNGVRLEELEAERGILEPA